MAQPGKHQSEGHGPPISTKGSARGPDHGQLDFELAFFAGVLERQPDYVDVLRILGNLLTLKGRFAEGLQIDQRLVQLRPVDALAHYAGESVSAATEVLPAADIVRQIASGAETLLRDRIHGLDLGQ